MVPPAAPPNTLYLIFFSRFLKLGLLLNIHRHGFSNLNHIEGFGVMASVIHRGLQATRGFRHILVRQHPL